jgi:hypothetical protein
MSGEQQRQLDRVSDAISEAIMTFRAKIGIGQHWRCEHLRTFVIQQCPKIAPASPDRVLRDLRKKGALDYRVVSRSGSLYEFTA